jgi:type IV pilus assembly protein PilM
MRAGIRSRPWAGIDIGSYSVKLLATQGGVASSRYWLAEARLPQTGEGPPADASADDIARTLAHCLEHAGLGTRALFGTSLGVSGPDVIVKQISLPLMDDDEVGQALRFEARKHLPFDPQGMVIDYQVLGRYQSEKRLDVLLAAVSQDRMNNLLAALRLLGLDADIVDAAPLALTNALVHRAEVDRDAHVLLDIGHMASHLTLYQRGEPYFSRRLEFGGRHLTEAIMKDSHVPFEEAEEFKLAAGSEEPGFLVDWELPEMQAMHECLRTRLADDLLRSLAFYRTIGRLPDQLNLWISGGSARIPSLAAQLTELVGLPVLLFNPLDFLTGEPRGGKRPVVAPQFAQAFGLALRSS